MKRGHVILSSMIILGSLTIDDTHLVAMARQQGLTQARIAHMGATQPSPYYAKWGRQAMEATRSRFPNAAIQDYLYVGRYPHDKKTNVGLTDEVFRLVLSDKGDLKTIIVVITVKDATQTLQKSNIQSLKTSPYKSESDRVTRQRH